MTHIFIPRVARASFWLLVSGLGFLLTCSASGVDRWPRFRGPNGSGVAEGDFPTHFGPGSNVLWEVPMGGGSSSPCIWETNLFMTAFTEGKLETLCLNSRDGTVRWRQAIQPGKIEQGARLASPADSTPCTDGERLFVYFASFGLLCYDFAGTEIWRHPLPTPVTQHGAATSPIVANGRVILGFDQDTESYLLAVGTTNGRTLWRTERPGYRRGFSTPIVWPAEKPELAVLPGTLRLAAYQLSDGALRWVAGGLPNEMVSSAVAGDELIYAAGWTHGAGVSRLPLFDELLERGDKNRDGQLTRAEAPQGPAAQHFIYVDANKDGTLTREEWDSMKKIFEQSKNALIAVRPGGRGDVTESHLAWTQTRGLPYVPCPLFYRDRVFLVKNGGLASLFEARIGKVFFQEERLGAMGDYYASPIAANGKILVLSQPGVAVVLKAGESLEILASNPLRDSVMATPAVVGDTLYLRTQKKLYAFRQKGP